MHSYANGRKVPWHFLGHDDEVKHTVISPLNRNAKPLLAANKDEVRVQIPRQIAVPFSEVCEKLGLPPVLTAAMDLWNWRLVDAQANSSLGKRTPSTPKGIGRAAQDASCPGMTASLFPRTKGTERWSWEPRRLEAMVMMTGTDTERYFHMLPCAMQVMRPNLVQSFTPRCILMAF